MSHVRPATRTTVDGDPATLVDTATALWELRPDKKSPARGPWGHVLACVVRALARDVEAAITLITSDPERREHPLILVIRREATLTSRRRGTPAAI